MQTWIHSRHRRFGWATQRGNHRGCLYGHGILGRCDPLLIRGCFGGQVRMIGSELYARIFYGKRILLRILLIIECDSLILAGTRHWQFSYMCKWPPDLRMAQDTCISYADCCSLRKHNVWIEMWAYECYTMQVWSTCTPKCVKKGIIWPSRHCMGDW
jgi:hypothetical protein